MTMTDEREGIADYKFIRPLGVGSHGVFYLAYPPKRLPVAAEFVAVKVLSGGSSQDVLRWAHRELAAFAAVSSPYLVTLYDAGQQGEEVYYSMEYLSGGSVAVPAEPLTRATALQAMAHAARATPCTKQVSLTATSSRAMSCSTRAGPSWPTWVSAMYSSRVAPSREWDRQEISGTSTRA